MPKYQVTYKHNLPIRPNITVAIEAENEDEINENGHLAAERKGVIFGPYAYSEKPLSVQQVK